MKHTNISKIYKRRIHSSERTGTICPQDLDTAAYRVWSDTFNTALAWLLTQIRTEGYSSNRQFAVEEAESYADRALESFQKRFNGE